MMNQKDRQLSVMAKEKLRWYTLEASDEEFDAGAVEALVSLISRLESGETEKAKESTQQNREALAEQFRKYCDLCMRDGAEERENALSDRRKIIYFRGKRFALLTAAACILMIIMICCSLGIVNAGEEQGFFHWLRKDENGTKWVTAPNNIESEARQIVHYSNIEEVPEEERQYLSGIEKLSELQGYELKYIQDRKMDMSQRISERFVMEEENLVVEIGVVICKEEIVIAWEQFDGYQYQESEVIGEYQQDIFLREKASGKREYMLVFLYENRKYFVSGNCSLEKLKKISEEYMNIILE